MEPTLLTIGKILNTRGLKGELKVASLTDFPLLRFRKGKTVYLEINGQYLPLTVHHAYHEGELTFVQFVNYLDINLVKTWMTLYLYAAKEDIRLKAGTYFFDELIGMKVHNLQHQPIGEVIAVERIAERVLLRISRPQQSPLLLPFLDVFVQQVDINNKVIHVTLLEGM
jgi:16S rRNA processing protein RimM